MRLRMRRLVTVHGLAYALVTALLFVVNVSSVAHAQQASDGLIARTYAIIGAQPVSGDLVSLDKAAQTLHLSATTSDEAIFGVVVTDPVIVLRSASTSVPVVTSGEAQVNVTARGGAIAPGDFITTSPVPGKGQRATSTDAFVVGMALASFPSTTTPVAATTTGSIPVLLQIGPYSGHPPAAASGISNQSAPTSVAAQTPKIGVPVFLKYLIAAVVAIGSIVVAFVNFGASVRNSVISIGRNPLARSSIQSMAILNTVLIVVVSAGGIFIGFVILFLPS